jgi:hypothetical protein
MSSSYRWIEATWMHILAKTHQPLDPAYMSV